MARRVPRASPTGAPPAAGEGAVIPYDYGATFAITGRPGNIVQQVINISPDGIFVAMAVGYGFEEERGRALAFQDRPVRTAILPGDLTLGELPTLALIEGLRVNPRFESLVFKTPGSELNGAQGDVGDLAFADVPVTEHLLAAKIESDTRQDALFQRVKTPEEISFLFSILDTGTGRELQDEPTHNLASLGKSDGERPFRLLAQPVTFLPRSSVRIQIIERTEGITGTLFVVLYGYRILGTSACPETVVRRLSGPPSCPVETIGRPSDRVIPFDYVTTIDLTGRPKNLVENETTVSVEGGFVATSVGYGLLVEEQAVAVSEPGKIKGQIDLIGVVEPVMLRSVSTNATLPLTLFAVPPGPSDRFESPLLPPGAYELRDSDSPTPHLLATIQVDAGQVTEVTGINAAGSPPTVARGRLERVNLGELPLRLFEAGALMDGIRIRPELVRLAFGDNARLNGGLPTGLLGQLFQRLNRPEDVSFRYTIFDSGRGRELQNQPLHNVAGLGIANGDRPFKRLARPMVFLPRSTIRIQVEERFGRGKLFFVFQGYKILRPPAVGGRV